MNVADRSSVMSDTEFTHLASVAEQEAGLHIPLSKKSLVQSRISRRMRELGLAACPDYLAHLDTNSAEKRELVSILTTNVTSFYREEHHFRYLVENVVPQLRAKLKKGDRVRLWSAGCSAGQEPFTIAIELLKAIPEASQADLLILGTDIDPKILLEANSGIYPEPGVETVDPNDRERFFVKTDGISPTYSVTDELRRIVRFRELNIHNPWPMKGAFDAIFCRNVVIYFDDDTQQKLWPRFRERLVEDGCLFLGHSERIHPLDTSGFRTVGVTVYQKT